MPIYEFYCGKCHTLFNFFSRTINTSKRPRCPRCKTMTLERQMSAFAVTGRSREADEMDELPVNETKMEQAMHLLAKEAEHVSDDDPKQAAHLMRKFTRMTGLELGGGMQEALRRMEQGEDPETIEAEMGDILENEDPFALVKKGGRGVKRGAPKRDEKLYDL